MYLNPNEPLRRLSARPAPTLALILGLLVLATGYYFGQRFMVPSPAEPASAHPAMFSADRAWPLLQRLVADGQPHPVDTAAGDAARQRVIAEFQAAGYEVETQTAWACREVYAACANVTNVLARLPGSGNGPALMLSAHYDSVGAGAGVSDDMAAVAAIIEVAGMLRTEPQLLNDVMFVITDGEEIGLVGAEAFLNHPWIDEVGLIANYEARGTAGQSLMFQTSPNNAWLIERFAAAAPRPATSSLLYEIYRLLPNDTDLSVYLDAEMAGINFAFVEGVERYHTALDDLQHLDRDTFQHQGENVLAAVRAFGNADLANMPAGNALYQDVYPGVVLQAPAEWAPWLAGGALVLWVLIVLALIGSGAITGGGLFLALIATLVGLAVAAGLGFGTVELIRLLTGITEPWYAQPLPARIAVWSAGALGFLFFASMAARRAGFWGMAAAVWLWWSGLSLAAALMLPGASVSPLLPTLVATIVYALLALLGVGLPTRRGTTIGWLPVLLSLLSVFAAAYVFLMLAYIIELGLGLFLGFAIALLVALAVSSVAPLLAVPRGAGPARAAVLLLALLTLVGGVVWSLRVPTYSAQQPQRLNVHYAQRVAGDAVAGTNWVLGVQETSEVPAGLITAGFGASAVTFPGGVGLLQAMDAPEFALPHPTLEILSDAVVGNQRVLSVRLASPRGADGMTLAVPRGVGTTSIDVPAAGRSIGYPLEGASGSWDRFECYGRSCDGLELTLETSANTEFDIVLMDFTAGLPEGGAALQAARPATASPTQDGDQTLVFNTIRIGLP